MALFAINYAVAKGKKAILIEPMEDLAKSKFHSLSKIFSQYKVGKTFNELTKDTQVLLLNDIFYGIHRSFILNSASLVLYQGSF